MGERVRRRRQAAGERRPRRRRQGGRPPASARPLDILVVDDDKALAGELAATLEQAGHRTTVAGHIAAARRRCRKQAYAVVILDRLLPGEDGLSFIPWLREHSEGTGVLVLSALDETEARVHGLNAGADDYLGKPYALEELLARVTALGRRHASAPVALRAGPIAMDRLARRVVVHGQEVHLNQREFSLLECFLLNVNETVTRSMLVREVWGYDLDAGANVIDVHVSRLRAKLEAHGCGGLLVTQYGVGYRLLDSAR